MFQYKLIFFSYFQNEEGTSQLRIKILAGQSLAKKDIFGARYVN